MMTHILDIIMLPVQLIVAFFTIYYTVIAVFGMWHRKEKIWRRLRAGSPWLSPPIMKKWCWRTSWKT